MYASIVPLLLLASLHPRCQKAARNMVAVSHVLLLLGCIAFWYQLYQLYQSLKAYMPADQSFVQSNFGTASAGMIAYISSYTLPFLLLIPSFRNSRLMALLLLILIWFPELRALCLQLSGQDISLPSYYWSYDTDLKIMFYISLFTGMYGLLYLLQLLPSQRRKVSPVT
jgi:hypothetical protein